MKRSMLSGPVRSLAALFRRADPAEAPGGAPAAMPATQAFERLGALLLAAVADAPGDGLAALEARKAVLLHVFKGFVAAERDRIEAEHRQGASGWVVVDRQSDLVDAVVAQLYRLADGVCPEPVRRRTEGCALMALGGYGRRELNPASDVDIMFLYPRRPDAYLTLVLEHVLYFLWDLGFSVGHSCRSIQDCLRIAESDFTSRTAMMEGRLLAGRRAIYERFEERLWQSLTARRIQQFVAQKLREREARYQRFGGSLYLQEPNVKEGAGGLRDFHTALWVARALHRVRGLADLQTLGLLTSAEVQQGRNSLDFLLRIRNELHYLTRGRTDTLTLALQEQVARNLGFRDAEGAHGVERFMQQYYLHARQLYFLAGRVLERCVPGRSQVEAVMRKLKARDIGDDFTEIDRQIHVLARSQGCFREDPVRLLKVFWYALETGYELAPETRDLIRAHVALIDDAVRSSNRALGFFLAILRERKGVARTLRAMHELGILGAYIPEFARLTCLVQFDYYHKYTADEHTFVALDDLERLYAGAGTQRLGDSAVPLGVPPTGEHAWPVRRASAGGGERDSPGPRLDEFGSIAHELKKPEVLKLAVLLHDVGKGEGRGHVERGTALARAILTRMGIPEGDREDVLFLVAEHLSMAHIAQRRDLDDEPMLIEFARKVGRPDLLKALYLLTYLDISAVGPDVWTEWKGTLLWELFIRTHTLLARGIPEGEEELAKAAKLRGALVEELGQEFPRPLVERHLDLMPTRYVLNTSAAKVAAHLALVQGLEGGEVVAARWQGYPLAGYSEVTVCAPGRPGRFAQIVGTLTANSLNILSAQIYTRKDGLVFRTFQVNDAQGSAQIDEGTWAAFHRDLLAVVRAEADVQDLIRSRRRALLSRPARRGPALPTRVEFDNVVSERYTVIDVRTQDRLGLLYVISRTLTDLGLDLALAKITTEVDQVLDVFYVTERDEEKIAEGPRMEEVRGALERAIAEGID